MLSGKFENRGRGLRGAIKTVCDRWNGVEPLEESIVLQKTPELVLKEQEPPRDKRGIVAFDWPTLSTPSPGAKRLFQAWRVLLLLLNYHNLDYRFLANPQGRALF